MILLNSRTHVKGSIASSFNCDWSVSFSYRSLSGTLVRYGQQHSSPPPPPEKPCVNGFARRSVMSSAFALSPRCIGKDDFQLKE